jgi:Na+-driven multidrug efflux pump
MGNINDMTVGSPTRDIIKFALPLICGYILQQMYLIIDAAIVGRWIGVGALAAVGASSSIMFLIMGFCNGSCAGFAIPVARSFGAKDFSDMRSYVSNALRISAVIAVVITVFTCIFCDRILKIVNTPTDVFHDAYIFSVAQLPGDTIHHRLQHPFGVHPCPGQLQTTVLFSHHLVIREYRSRRDSHLIIGMGVEGAGIATLLSQAFSGLLCWLYIKKKMHILIPTGEERRYDDHKVGRLLNSGIPMGLQFSITGIGIIMLQSANNALGTTYVAAFTASMRVKYLFTCVFENIGVAMATYCGQNIGAREVHRIALGIRSAIKIMLIYFVFTLILIVPFADYMMMLFVNPGETAIVSNAAMFMRISCYFYPVLGLLTILRYSIQGLGYSNLSMLSGVMEMIARCGVSIWIVPALHFLGVCYGDPMAWMAADLFLVPTMILIYRRLKTKVESC